MTADMVLQKNYLGDWVPSTTIECPFNDWIFPAWSLHRLKCLLPEKTTYGDGYLAVEIIDENVYIVLVIENVEQRVLKYTKGNLYDNLISCINFFVKESLLNKDYLEE